MASMIEVQISGVRSGPVLIMILVIIIIMIIILLLIILA